MIFLEASEKAAKNLFWPGFSYFDKQRKAQNWRFFTKLCTKSGFYGKTLSAVIDHLVQK